MRGYSKGVPFMADISAMIHRKSLRAKQKAAIRTIRQQTKEKIRAIKLSYAENPGQLAQKMRQGPERIELPPPGIPQGTDRKGINRPGDHQAKEHDLRCDSSPQQQP